MSHQYRFIAERLGPLDWKISQEEWQHALKVLRLSVDDEIELTNGLGWISHCKITTVGKRTGSFICSSEVYIGRDDESSRAVTLVIGALKPQVIDEFLPSIIELGVDQILVFASEGSEKTRIAEKIQERWERVIQSSCKQSKRPWFPDVLWYENLCSALTAAVKQGKFQKLFFDANASNSLKDVITHQGESVLAVIGSEKGFTEAEYQELIQHEFLGVKMNGHILRAATANIAAMALLKNM